MAKPSVQKKSPADRKWKRPPGSPVKEDQVSPEDFARIWYECDCSASVMAERTGLGLRNIYKRRERLSADGFSLPGPGVNQGMLPSKWTYPREIHVNIESGTVLVGNDAHIWPETHCPIPPIRKVFAQIGKSLKVDYTILNGDLVDGTRISRWPRLRGQNTPKFLEELQAANSDIGETSGDHQTGCSSIKQQHAFRTGLEASR